MVNAFTENVNNLSKCQKKKVQLRWDWMFHLRKEIGGKKLGRE